MRMKNNKGANSNALFLRPKEWIVILLLLTLTFIGLPIISKKSKQSNDSNYRIPYQLSNDYWSYTKLTSQLSEKEIPIIGDSVIWGEYVDKNSSLSYFLSDLSGHKFTNAGMNGLYPLALEGLIKNHAKPIKKRKVLLHLNLLWMSSPERDLSTTKEQTFNHPQLIPQIVRKVPSYHASTEKRLSRFATNSVPFLSFVNHIKENHFSQRSPAEWTCLQSDVNPEHFPNTYLNPLNQLFSTAPIPIDEQLNLSINNTERGVNSPRHKPWSGAPRTLDWISMDDSLQWNAFKKLCTELLSRKNNLFVLIGPLNNHMFNEMTTSKANLLTDEAGEWLKSMQIDHWSPQPLPSDHYADASHPLTHGYEMLAKELLKNKSFTDWVQPR